MTPPVTTPDPLDDGWRLSGTEEGPEHAARLYDGAQRPPRLTTTSPNESADGVAYLEALRQADAVYWEVASDVVRLVVDATLAPDLELLGRLDAARRLLLGLPAIDDLPRRRAAYLRKFRHIVDRAKARDWLPCAAPERTFYYLHAQDLRHFDAAFEGLEGETLYRAVRPLLDTLPAAGVSKGVPRCAAELAVYAGAFRSWNDRDTPADLARDAQKALTNADAVVVRR